MGFSGCYLVFLAELYRVLRGPWLVLNECRFLDSPSATVVCYYGHPFQLLSAGQGWRTRGGGARGPEDQSKAFICRFNPPLHPPHPLHPLSVSSHANPFLFPDPQCVCVSSSSGLLCLYQCFPEFFLLPGFPILKPLFIYFAWGGISPTWLLPNRKAFQFTVMGCTGVLFTLLLWLL